MKRIAVLLLAVLALAGVVWADSALLINGAGATFPYPIYSKWFDEYHKTNGAAQINYQSVGSGAGIKQVTEGTVDFGATYIWTDYFSKVSADWKDKVGKGTSVNWPVGLGGKGNENVTGLVKQTPNAIGYVELIYAVQNKIPYGAVKNAVGEFVTADLASVSAAAAAASTTMPDDFRVSITNAKGKGVYPISSFTWLLIPQKFTDASKRDAIKGFVTWMLADGQNYAENLSYAKLPKEVVAKELTALNKIQ